MKIKYYRLSKEEQKDYRTRFYNTNKGKNLKKYTKISYITTFLLLIMGIYNILDTYFNHLSKYYYYYGALIIILSIIMLFSIHRLRIKAINNYIVKK